MPKQFKGKIKLDIRDSTPDWTAFLRRQGARGRAERARRPLRRHRPGGVVAVRRADQHADAGPAGRQRPDLLAVAHHRAVLADPLVLPHRAQPPPERLRLDLRDRDRLPRLQLAHPAARTRRWRPCCATPAGARSGSARTTTCPVDAWTMGSSKKRLAARPGLRPLLRLHRRRDQPVVSRPGRGQPLRRPALPARGRLPPVEGPRRQGARVHPRLQAVASRTSRGTCGSAPAPTTPRTTRRRSTSTSTRACSTTATRPTASGCCRG